MPLPKQVIYRDIPEVEDKQVCPVCSDRAPVGEVHHPHYGAICCFSCKAFFRRANQVSRASKYHCKRDGKCTIFPKCGQHCKRCRFDKCLAIGMNPKWVMSNEDKRIRFKNFYQKRTEKSRTTSSSGISTSTSRSRTRGRERASTVNAERDEETAPSPVRTLMDPGIHDRPYRSASTPCNNGSWIPLDLEHPTEMPNQRIKVKQEEEQPRFDAESNYGSAPWNLAPTDNHPWTSPSFIGHSYSHGPYGTMLWPQNLYSPNTYPQQPCAWPSVYPSHIQIMPPCPEPFEWGRPGCALHQPYPMVGERDQWHESTAADPIRPDEQHAMVNDHKEEKEVGQAGDSRFLSLQSQLSSVLDAFTITTGSISFDSHTTQEIIQSHQEHKPFKKSTLEAQLGVIASVMKEFAKSQFLFLSLTKSDQDILLKKNTPLYLQYILARYFSAETGLEQLNWILEGQILIESIEDVSDLNKICLKEFKGLFSAAESLEAYNTLVKNVSLFYSFPQHCNGLITNMLLYHTDDTIMEELQEAKRIDCIFKEAQFLVKLGYDHMDRSLEFNPCSNIGPLIRTLSLMCKILGEDQVQKTDTSLAPPNALLINYTQDEEIWLRSKFDQFKEEYSSVSMPKTYFDQLYNLLMFGKQVEDTFVPLWMGMETERVRRVLKMHPEFLSLCDKDQETLWRKNQPSATALAAVRLNLLTSGKEQFQHAMGILTAGDSTQEEDFHSKDINLDLMKPTYLNRAELNAGHLDEASIACYHEIMKDLSGMFKNVHMYQLFTLLTLLDTDGLPPSSSVMKIAAARKTYLNIFQRKLASIGCSFTDYSHFRKTLNKVKLFSTLMENFMP